LKKVLEWLLVIVLVYLVVHVVTLYKSGILVFDFSFFNTQPDEILYEVKDNQFKEPSINSIQDNLCKTKGYISRSMFTSNIENHLPISRKTYLKETDNKVFFFTEISSPSSRTIKYRWFYNDNLIANVAADQIKQLSDKKTLSSWSSRKITGTGTDSWHVEVWIDNCLLGKEAIGFINSINTEDIKTGWQPPQSAIWTLLQNSLKEVTLNDNFQPEHYYLDDNYSVEVVIPNHSVQPKYYQEKIISYKKIPKSTTMDDLTKVVLSNKSFSNIPNWNVRQFINRRNINGDTPLLEAVKNNSTKTLKSLISLGANPFLKNSNGKSPAELAHQMGSSDVVEMLINAMINASPISNSKTWDLTILKDLLRKDNVNQRNKYGNTLLHEAALSGNEQAALTLLRLTQTEERLNDHKISDPYYYNYLGNLPIDLAKKSNSHGVYVLLQRYMSTTLPKWAVSRAVIANKINNSEPSECYSNVTEDIEKMYYFTELTDIKSRPVQHVWIHEDNPVQIVDIMPNSSSFVAISSQPIDLSSIGNWIVETRYNEKKVSYSSFRVFDTKGGTKRVLFSSPKCIEHRLTYNIQAMVDAWVPLQNLQDLIDKKYPIIYKYEKMKSLIKSSVDSRNIFLTRWLVDQGFDINKEIQKSNDMTIISAAVKNSDIPMYMFSNLMGAMKNRINKYKKNNLLQIAINNDHIGMMKLLIKNGVNINNRSRSGNTPLISAVLNCSYEATKLLIKSGADIKAKNDFKKSAQDYSQRCTPHIWSNEQLKNLNLVID